jgi:hypothetical protein
MSCSDAGRLGKEKSLALQQAMKQERINKYLENPKLCGTCGAIIPYNKRVNNFCSSSCFACHNNKQRSLLNPCVNFCMNCGKDLKSKTLLFCSGSCHKKHSHNKYIERWLAGEESGGIGKDKDITSHTVRDWVFKKSGGKCSVCGGSDWMGKKMPLILDHIDGHSKNNRPENLRAVCGNCDMQLPTYKSKNKGNGRHYRRERYKNGLSY